MKLKTYLIQEIDKGLCLAIPELEKVAFITTNPRIVFSIGKQTLVGKRGVITREVIKTQPPDFQKLLHLASRSGRYDEKVLPERTRVEGQR